MAIKEKKIIIITDELEPVRTIIDQLETMLSVPVTRLSYDDLRSEASREKLHTSNPLNLVLLLEYSFHEEHSREIQQYLDSIFNKYWPAIIKIHVRWDFNTIGNFDIYNYGNYLLLPDENPLLQATGLSFFLIQAMHTAELDFQVCDHLSGSIKEIISSEMLKGKNEELEQRSRIDYLTKLYNRNTFYSMLKTNIQSAKRDIWRLHKDASLHQQPEIKSETRASHFPHQPKGRLVEHFGKIALMMIDIDNFKKVNDTHGHLVGDVVLKTFSQLLLSSRVFRNDDVAGRFGGEEFTVILPHTNAENAKIPAMRLMDELADITFKGINDCEFQITVSIGISEYHRDDSIELDVIHRADMALYKAKELGRNRIIVYEVFFSGKA